MQSTNITVTLTKKQYLTIKNLFHATLKDETSPLRYVYYHAQKRQVVACDRQLIRWEKIDLGKNDIFFESHYFSHNKSAIKYIFPYESTTYIFTIPQEENIGPYPNYESAFPPKKFMKPFSGFAPALDPKKLQKFDKSVTDEYAGYMLIPTNKSVSAIYVYGIGIDRDTTKDKILGLIMPIHCEESRENIQKIKEKNQ